METRDDAPPSEMDAMETPSKDEREFDTGEVDSSTNAVQEKSQDTDQRRQQHSDHILNKHESERPHEDASNPSNHGANEEKDTGNPKNKQKEGKADGPAGGFDSTPIPNPPSGSVGYTLKITFHSANNLAIGDAQTFSSDPYLIAQLNTNVDTRHKEDPRLRFRTFTVRKTTNAEWNENWIVANVPSSGFKLKVRVYDEDPADHDDLLGKAAISVPSIGDSWQGIKEESYKLSLAQSSKRAVLVRGFATCFGILPRQLKGDVVVSIENLGRTGEDGQNGRLYTVGECRWFQYYSPLLGRITNTKDGTSGPDRNDEKQVEHYNFQANQIQLQGPVPAELYHRFVEFKPWVKRMFTTTGVQGLLLGKALHHQHTRVYNPGRSTAWGRFPQGPCEDLTRKFLELVHYDKGGRIFTYVLTLDALWRFTETGKEFGIDMLSKHTMHSDVSVYIAFSGEFFVRRLKHRHRPPPPHPTETTAPQDTEPHKPNHSHTPKDVGHEQPDEDPPKDPKYYELFIDNDSGTYRPNAKLLPLLADFMAKALPGLHIQTLDCQANAKRMSRLKTEQRERKKRENNQAVYTQDNRSSFSSSDDERLDQLEVEAHGHGDEDSASGVGANGEHGTAKAFAKDIKLQNAGRWDKVKRQYGAGGGRGAGGEDGEIHGGTDEGTPPPQQQQQEEE